MNLVERVFTNVEVRSFGSDCSFVKIATATFVWLGDFDLTCVRFDLARGFDMNGAVSKEFFARRRRRKWKHALTKFFFESVQRTFSVHAKGKPLEILENVPPTYLRFANKKENS